MILLTVSKPRHVCNECNISFNDHVYYKIDICRRCREKIEVINGLFYPIRNRLHFLLLKREWKKELTKLERED